MTGASAEAVREISPPEGEMRESRLPSGVRVLTETIPGVRSVGAGVWVRFGSAHEDPDALGAAHLLEHLVFKGTETRTPREIAFSLEGLGGSLDAYTSREHTGYQARVLDEHLPAALEVLADLTLRPLLRADDLEREREVVLEEISTVEDTPDDLVYEIHGRRLWGDHPYGRPILGTRESVAGMRVETLRAVHEGHYRGGNLVVAAAGHVEHEEVVERAAELFGGVEAAPAAPELPRPEDPEPVVERVEREGAQIHLVIGAPTPDHSHPDRYPLALLTSALGGGMSSRLFQRVREELALAYAVYTFQSFYARAGVTGVYVGTRPGWGARALEVVREELAQVAEEGLPAEEVEQVRRQVKGQIMLSLESTGARLHRLAGFALYDEPFLDLDGLLARVDAISTEDVARAAQWLHPDRQVVVRLGPGA